MQRHPVLRFAHDQNGKSKRCTEGPMDSEDNGPKRPHLLTRAEKPPSFSRERRLGPILFPLQQKPSWRVLFASLTLCKRAPDQSPWQSFHSGLCEGASNFPVHGAISCRILITLTWTRTVNFCICSFSFSVLLQIFPILDASRSSPLPWPRQ
jgi:hypothetical protein